MLRLLLDAGVADVNAQDGRGNTAMILAAENPVSCSMDMVRALVEDGGDMNTRNDDGETASEVLWQTHRVQLKQMVR